ncbi:acyl-CoA dehydrogenase [Novosphingobium sp. PC22D]|uniref:acyl-CoA dehydrogenase family protein n=1 Tax=Novosphingobium sp. PC22D TaxID=1962403 RepID=UPI000BF1D8B5|nr:acyl-CoA dehydrogenase family protein [Novosphingobium sp. PC22D]PEQ10584.1 acyl-CoA dehydrogenase [Novosphingobium sp. PC22D]
MNFDFSDDQKFLKREARKFLEAACPIATTRSVLDSRDKPFDEPLWRKVVEMGWTGTVIPEKWGGSGLGHTDLCAIAEELGRVIAPIPFASTVYVFAEAILAFGEDRQCERLLPAIAAGEAIGCLAVGEGRGRLACDAMTTRVEDERLHGAKIPVTDGDIATHAIVAARDDAGLGLFVVDLATAEGVRREPIESLDPTRSAARIVFEGAECERLGAAGEGKAQLDTVMNRAAVLFAFEQLGGADRCLETAREYALERYAFGRVIASYQAIKHKLADIYVKNELARSHAYYGAWALGAGESNLPLAAAAARVAGIQSYDFAAKENLQTHGGIGFTWEVDCHLHLRRSRQLALALGGISNWREQLVQELEARNQH